MVLSFRESLQQASKGVLCTALAVEDNLTSWLGSIPVPGNGFSNENLFPARKVRQFFCSNPTPVVGPSPLFTGGQCPGVAYHVTVNVAFDSFSGLQTRTFQFGFTSNTSNQVFGPISDIRVSPTQFRVLMDARDRNGGPKLFQSELWQSGYNDSFRITSATVVPRFGGPDNCGSLPPPPFPPYVPVVITREFTYVDNTNIEITEEGDFTILAPIFVAGNIIAPIRVDVGGVEFPINFNLETGEITLDFSRDFTETPPPVVGPGTPVPPSVEEPEREEDELIYALVVYSAPTGTPPVTSSVAQQNAPVLRLPRTGNVYFQIPVGDRFTWTGPIPVQTENQLVVVPGGYGASGYRLVPNTGWDLSAVRVGRAPEP